VELMGRRAIAFLETAKHSLKQGNYDIAAFNAEQATQLYLKSTLLELVGDFPRTNSIILLLRELEHVNEEVGKFIKENKRGLHNLEDSYLTSRYFYKIFDREDSGYLVSLSEEVIRFCEKLRSSKGDILEDWKKWIGRIKEAAGEILASNMVGFYLFGSAVTGDLVASSDIDLLIVARNLPKSITGRSELKERIIERSGLPPVHPFEIHLVDEDEARIYFRHIGGKFLKV